VKLVYDMIEVIIRTFRSTREPVCAGDWRFWLPPDEYEILRGLQADYPHLIQPRGPGQLAVKFRGIDVYCDPAVTNIELKKD